MTGVELKHIANSHYRKIKRAVGKPDFSLNAEQLHLFRVEYKKLRAFLRLLSNGRLTIARLKTGKELKKTYSVAGQIRDLQLQQERLIQTFKQRPKKPVSYLNLLKREIEQLQPQLSALVKDDPVAPAKKKANARYPPSLSLQRFRIFAREKMTAIAAVIEQCKFSDTNIHLIRKMLKDVLYNLNNYSGLEHAVLSVTVWKGKEEQYIANMLDEMGDLQDQCTAIALLKSEWIRGLNSYNQKMLAELKKEWIKKKIAMKQALVKKLKADYTVLFEQPSTKSP